MIFQRKLMVKERPLEQGDVINYQGWKYIYDSNPVPSKAHLISYPEGLPEIILMEDLRTYGFYVARMDNGPVTVAIEMATLLE